MWFFWQGLILGFSIAAPVGPIGVLCIRRTLSDGMRIGLISGLGTATADAVYGLIAALGLTALTTLLIEHQWYLRSLGGLFLLYLGYTIFRSHPAQAAATASHTNLLSAYSSAFVLTITNPMTILSFAAVFAGLGAGSSGSIHEALLLVSGVFSGSMLWWLVLSGLVHSLRSRFTPNKLRWVNQLSGLIIAGFGMVSLWACRVG